MEGFSRASREWFDQPVVALAPQLLGGLLVRTTTEGTVAVRITEVEAYAGADDPGSHAFRGMTPRNATMFGPPGHLYCYLSYGVHFNLNVVCDGEGVGTGCLLRAGEVVDGLALARGRRSARPRRTRLLDHQLARGPGNLGQALGSSRQADGADLMGEQWSWWRPEVAPTTWLTGPRVGVSGPGGDGERFPWRFWLPDEPSVSAYRRAG
ncbi:DNA-3-methyladenine glycosylase [Arachnia propionica]|uniref:Putative 3-methyladenine DNA glycosylase n=1 Tax=Arachnia propionica TaxID=1750 RepID=A0A3P1T7U8_9ACTN|nr:DNA-3-methyladenine glycosylase [Arachnia propionica]MDO5083227.1 DNA-3-methyladenine glycosylase [Arachnia propionica]RRD05494.1 DNA-3-methyladenine glycosylase [Arachnia propionica]